MRFPPRAAQGQFWLVLITSGLSTVLANSWMQSVNFSYRVLVGKETNGETQA
jgi:hypothetical protein